MASPVARHRGPTTLTDELLEEIFLRLPTPADLARACTASASFRRIITDRSFLRRFRAIHPPPLLGFVNSRGFHPTEPPHPSAPLGRAVADAADFTYSFVPAPPRIWGRFWYPRDVRDGRVLLEGTSTFLGDQDEFPANLAVCDPLSRRYVLLPRIPEDLALQQQQDQLLRFAPFLAPIGVDEDETSFKVIGMAQYKSKLLVFAFSSITGEWCIAASPSWSSLGMDSPSERIGLPHFDYVHGNFYWANPWGNKLFGLDVGRMEFSTVDVPDGYEMLRKGTPHIVMDREGAFGMCSIDLYVDPSTPFEVYHYTTQNNNSGSSRKWQVDRVIPVAGQNFCLIMGAADELLFLEGNPRVEIPVPYVVPLPENDDLDYFTLNVRTSELTKVFRTRIYENEVISCAPILWLPAITVTARSMNW